jgi:hypothetical protein
MHQVSSGASGGHSDAPQTRGSEAKHTSKMGAAFMHKGGHPTTTTNRLIAAVLAGQR